ncbi:MAG TPA: EAL domain-containing protein [Roseiflexaceae bacterium]|nr:EAL domain-containing protein [Roseiflexaceae bacterium]
MAPESRPALLERYPEVLTFSNVMLPAANLHEVSAEELLRDALQTIRLHLGMDVAFVSEFCEGRRFFRYVDAPDDTTPISVGGSDPLEESYCQHIVDGRLPRLIQDASLIPLALTLPVTTELPVGAHISVPIHLSDGRVYGTFCCFKTVPDMTLVERDLALVQIFAEFTGKQLERQLAANRTHAEMLARIQSIIDTQSFALVYQPIFDFAANRIVGFETLARFAAVPIRPPNLWFDEAAQVGLVEALEMTVIAQALKGLTQLPQGSYLTINVSPATVLSDEFIALIQTAELERIILEITEHVSITDYEQLNAALAPLREQGMRLAVDDAGAGYASFRHVLRLDPDVIKLDISLTRDIDTDPTRRALAAALTRFAEETGSKVIAEGVETEAELAMLRQLNINKAQGYLIGRPMPLANALVLLQSPAHGEPRQ